MVFLFYLEYYKKHDKYQKNYFTQTPQFQDTKF